MVLVIKPSQRKPPVGAPEGTAWFGGPVDRFEISLRVFGEGLDPDRISAMLGSQPSQSARKGDPFPRNGRWILSLTSEECGEEFDVEDAVKLLLDRLPSDSELWAALHRDYKVDVFCGIFMGRENQGFEIPPETLRMLAERGLKIGFDVYAPENERIKSGRA